MMQTYRADIAAGGQWVWDVTGRYLRVIAASDDMSITFFSRGNVKGAANGVGVGFWAKPDSAFDRLIIKSDVAQSVTVLVGSGEAGFDIQATVSGEWQSSAKTFSQVVGLGAVAGQYPQFALLPPATGISAVEVDQIYFNSSVVGLLKVGWVPWATISAAWGGGQGVTNLPSHRAGAPNAQSVIMTPGGGANAYAPAWGAGNTFSIPVSAGQTFQVQTPVPWVASDDRTRALLVWFNQQNVAPTVSIVMRER